MRSLNGEGGWNMWWRLRPRRRREPGSRSIFRTAKASVTRPVPWAKTNGAKWKACTATPDRNRITGLISGAPIPRHSGKSGCPMTEPTGSAGNYRRFRSLFHFSILPPAEFKIMNAGIGGWHIRAFMNDDRGRNVDTALSLLKPDVMFLEFSANDDWFYFQRKTRGKPQVVSDDELADGRCRSSIR